MDGEEYKRTIEKLLNSDDVSPIMKRVLEKELHRANRKSVKSMGSKSEVESNSATGATGATGATDSNSDSHRKQKSSEMEGEMKDALEEEKKIFDQADTAIKNMEGWLCENKKTSPLLRSLIEYTLKKLKHIRNRAQENMNDIRNEMNEIHAQEQNNKTSSSNNNDNNDNNDNNKNNKNNGDGDNQTRRTTERGKNEEEGEKKGENKQGSDFMNSLEPPKNSSESFGVGYFPIFLSLFFIL